MIETSLGLTLPSDYKEFLELYGAGTVGTFTIHSPFVWLTQGFDVRHAWGRWASIYEDYANILGMKLDYQIFPQSEGLLPFGSVGDGSLLNWHTVGEPESWPFVYYDHENMVFSELHGFSIFELVFEMLTQKSSWLAEVGLAGKLTPPFSFKPYSDL